jgi:hypothetical protein
VGLRTFNLPTTPFGPDAKHELYRFWNFSQKGATEPESRFPSYFHKT